VPVQRFPPEEFHDGEDDAVLATDVVQSDDVWMRQSGDGPSLSFESSESVRIVHQISGYNLHGDLAAESRVRRAIDFAHTSSAERRQDLIGTKSRTCR
jgi:hypothetical protein